jgi:hypothetical protein
MIRVFLIIIIAFVIYKIYQIKYLHPNVCQDDFINITNPFVNGLSQFQLGSTRPDDGSILGNDDDDLSMYDYKYKSNNVLNKKLNDDINTISKLRMQSINKSKLKAKPKLVKFDVTNTPKKLNKFFMATQFNDSYRDIMTCINMICPDQKIIFNLQSLPVTTVMYDLRKELPPAVKKLVNQFIIKLNQNIKTLPESTDILNTYNNYLPMTSSLKKYVQDKGINKFYKDIGVDYNLYPDTPPNAPVELIRVLGARREFTEAETKYIITVVFKKVLKSVSDQMKVTIHFVLKNDPLEADNMFSKTITPRLTQQIAIEFIFTDGYYTNDYNTEYDCYGSGEKSKHHTNNDGDDNFYSFNALGKDTMISDNQVITELNKKNREHEIEMANFNVNIPYPIYQNPANAKPPKFV